MGKHYDLSAFGKKQVAMAWHLGQSIATTAAFFRDVLGVQRSGPTKAVQEKKSNEQGDRVMGGQGSMMHAGSSSWPMLSDSTEESL